MLTLLQDPALARTLGHNAQRWANDQLSWPILAQKIEHVYYELLEPQALTMLHKPSTVGTDPR
jgi:hypothetical protein